MTSQNDLIAARANLWKAQQRFKYFPRLYMVINNLYGFDWSDPKTVNYTLPELWEDYGTPDEWALARGPALLCYLDPVLLQRILDREAHWNNCEIGCLIEFDRRPNNYLPDVHTLLSFFHKPAGS